MKQCSKCDEVKELNCFHRDKNSRDGKKTACKPCRIGMSKAWAEANPERVSENRKRWSKDNAEGINAKSRLYRAKYPDRCNSHTRRWRENNPDKYKALLSRRHAENPNGRRARNALNKSIAAGRMVRATHCSRCGTSGNIDAHHDSYEPERWLDVRWLCKSCHQRHHAEERKRIEASEISSGAQ